MPRVAVLVGTRKGLFIVESDQTRREWKVRGPYLEGQNVMHATADPRSGGILAAAQDWWFGPRIYQSRDAGHTWDEPASGPTFPPDSGVKLEKVWHVEPGRPQEPGVIYAGGEPAALFKSSDGGQTWEWVKSLEEHPSRVDWQPSAGGLCLHTIILDPTDQGRLYAGISAAGFFRTDDGASSWRPANQGVRANFMPEQPPVYPEWGQCVHKVVQNPARPERLYQQNHCGVYRSDDRGETWTEITGDLPSDWGHAAAVHPHDPDTFYVCQGTSGYKHWVPDARMAVYRTRDAGATWQALHRGFPDHEAFVHVLREGMAADTLRPCGLYLGTNTGQLYHSADEGDTWAMVPALFPPISSVSTVTL